ncbi:DUF362 domain-containing protein [bacterium]|nr:DUF362 domain-containing protein [bacterium]
MEILLKKTQKRREFIKEAFLWGKIYDKIKNKKKILLKPNIVSYEEYPTTTHPETIEECLKLLVEMKKQEEIVVADGPAFDAGNSDKIIQNHPIKKVCDAFGVLCLNLNRLPKRKIKMEGYTFLIPKIIFEFDYVISLPVLKTHRICKITGAFKNQYGFLSPKRKLYYHLPFKDINKAIVLLNKIKKIDFFIVDAIKTLIFAQEKRHGGKERNLGYMLAGKDPFELDKIGFRLLKEIDPSLAKIEEKDIPQFIWAKKLWQNT